MRTVDVGRGTWDVGRGRRGRSAECRGLSRPSPLVLHLSATSYVLRPTSYVGFGRRGIALILVVSVLAVVGIMATSFAFWMRMEQRAAANFLETVRTRYLAEAAVAHARLALVQDRWRNRYDGYDESWATLFRGTDVDLDDDGAPDARWLPVPIPATGEPVSWRYAVLIRDEAGKINVNTAGRYNSQMLGVVQGWTPFEVGLEPFLRATGALPDPSVVADAVIAGRYGPDGQPGVVATDDDGDNALLAADGVDNDADGQADEPQEGVDEPDEYRPWWPLGDDQPWLTVDAVRASAQVDDAAFTALRRDLTVHSRDIAVYPSPAPAGSVIRWINQWNLNTATADEMLGALIAGGVARPWQLAANIADAVDADDAQSLVAKTSLTLSVGAAAVEPGGWTASLTQEAYENHQPGSAPGVFRWSDVPIGTYAAVVYAGASGSAVGVATVDGTSSALLMDSAYLPGTVTIGDDLPADGLGTFQITMANPPDAGSGACRFAAVELMPISGGVGLPVVFVRGAETIRINEVMVKPWLDQVVSQTQQPGGDWVWEQDRYRNDVAQGGPSGEGTFTWSGVPDGSYYLWVYGEPGQAVGDVTVGGVRQNGLRDGDRFTALPAVTVTGGTLTLRVQNNLLSGSCLVQRIVLSQQPDAEYVEVVNLGRASVDLSGWQVQGPGSVGWPARVPLGTRIEPGGYLVLAVDADDRATGLSSNGISLRDRWGGVQIVQLDFDRSVTPEADLLSDTPIPDEDFVVLRDPDGRIVDVVEYAAGAPEWTSLEKADPTAVSDGNGNGVDDGWFPSASGGTPGLANRNDGFLERVGQVEITHSPAEVTVDSRPLASIGDVGRIGTGQAWRTVDPAAIAGLAEVAAVHGVRLELERAAEAQPGDWQEETRAAPATTWFVSTASGAEGTWRWDQRNGLVNGVYTLRLGGRAAEGLRVAIQRADGSWSSFSTALVPGPNGLATYGAVEIGIDSSVGTASQTLVVKIQNASLTGTAHADFLQLDPQVAILGRINVNTASRAVLQALPGVDAATADAIIAHRPYGRIGDLLLSGALGPLGSSDGDAAARQQQRQAEQRFAGLANLVTVRSHLYEVVTVAQAVRGGRVVAQQKLRTVIER